MARAFLYTVNSATQTVPQNGAVQPGSTIRRFGCGLSLNGDSVAVVGDGYYTLDAVIVAEPDAAGDITATLYENGIAIPGASTTVTAAAGATVAIPVIGAIRKSCCGNGVSSVTCVLSAAASVTGYTFRAEKL